MNYLSKYILKVIYILIIIIQIIVLTILFIKKPLPEYMHSFYGLSIKCVGVIFITFFIAIICYIFEHKKYSKNENILDEDIIPAKFDIDLKNYDILYLSTILNQKCPDKKEIILLIMQLINKKVIDLSYYYDGDHYEYMIEKRTNYKNQITRIEKDVLDYLFDNSNRVNLIYKVKEIYSNKNRKISNILRSASIQMQKINLLICNPEKLIYEILATIISIAVAFLGFSLFIIEAPKLFKTTPAGVAVIIGLSVVLVIVIAFVCTLILKKISQTYQYTNDTYSWLCKNIIFIATCLIISYTFSELVIVHFTVIIIYLFTQLTIMIKYNNHISLSQDDLVIRKKLIGLKNFFKNMNYLKDKEFANIITYEECLMYGFLFNITIKVNEEFDLLQKELFNVVKTEGHLYIELFKDNIL